MFKKIIILLLVPIFVFGSDEKYVIDKTHFSIGFLVEHVGYAKTLGMFKEIDGSYTHDLVNNKINDILFFYNQDYSQIDPEN